MPPLLTEKHYELINASLHSVGELIPELEKAIRAGINVHAQYNQARHYQAQLLQFKAIYFPGRP